MSVTSGHLESSWPIINISHVKESLLVLGSSPVLTFSRQQEMRPGRIIAKVFVWLRRSLALRPSSPWSFSSASWLPSWARSTASSGTSAARSAREDKVRISPGLGPLFSFELCLNSGLITGHNLAGVALFLIESMEYCIGYSLSSQGARLRFPPQQI